MLINKEKYKNLEQNINNSNEEVVDKVIKVDINKIKKNKNNFYNEIYELEALEESLKEVGQIEPIKITKDYVVLSGHRRLEALKRIGSEEVLANIVNESDDNVLFLIEANRYRIKTKEELNEEVLNLKEYFLNLEKKGEKPKGRLRDLIAEKLGVSSSTVARTLNQNKTILTEEEIIEKEFKKIQNSIKKIEKYKLNENTKDLIYKIEKMINQETKQLNLNNIN